MVLAIIDIPTPGKFESRSQITWRSNKRQTVQNPDEIAHDKTDPALIRTGAKAAPSFRSMRSIGPESRTLNRPWIPVCFNCVMMGAGGRPLDSRQRLPQPGKVPARIARNT